jgi:hypothetical protein
MPLLAKWRDALWNDPLLTLAVMAALAALAFTPIAFAVLGRMQWFKARRGRTMQTPTFASLVVAMMLVMGVPAIFLALVVKSQYFDKDRYEFDPNKTWSVLEQGRSYHDLTEADKAVKDEMGRLALERKNLVDSVKKLDEAMLALRAVAGTSPSVAQAVPNVLQRLAKVRASVGVDGPQQLMDFTAPPVDLAAVAAATPVPAAPLANVPAPATAPAAAPAPAGNGLTKAQIDAELAAVPEPQRALAAMLPLSDLPPGWALGTLGQGHIETFNAENLFEKINGRAESFIDYGVKGMAYADFHPVGDETADVQVYIFEMGGTLKALGKYAAEKPEESQTLAIGSEGYTSAGSTIFYSGPYYTQVVTTTDDPKFAAFSLELARRIAARQNPQSASTPPAASPTPAPAAPAATAAAAPTPTPTPAPTPSPAGEKPRPQAGTPEALFALLPAEPGRASPKYVAQDAFGYSFLSDVFMADYQQDGTTWQGFLRPYRDAKEAEAVFDKYVAGAKLDGAEIKTIEAEGADRMIVSANIGLIDVIFLRGNVVGGTNGATQEKPAEAFARAFVKSLPADIPAIETGK